MGHSLDVAPAGRLLRLWRHGKAVAWWRSPSWVDVRAGLIIFFASLIGIFEVGMMVAATGGLPNVYVNLYYPVLAIAAFSLPLPAAAVLAVVAGLVPSHQGLLSIQAFSQGLEGLVRPFSFLVISGAVSAMSGALRRQLEKERALREELEREAREREAARQAAERSEQQMRLLLDHVQDMVAFVDATGRVLEVNPKVEELGGWSRHEVLGRHIREFVHPQDWRCFCRGLSPKALDRRQKFEVRLQTRDGRWLVTEAVVVPVQQSQGAGGWVITAQDVTARRRAEAERDEALLRLLAAQDEERRRVGYDFHDGPIQSMVAALAFLETHAWHHRRPDPHLERALHNLRRALQEARYIVSHLTPQELREGGLPKALASILQAVRDNWGIETHLEVSCGEWRMAYPREAALLRIAQEAINNAVKHSGTGRIEVRLWRAGQALHLSVRDFGRGIQGSEGSGCHGHLGILSMRERAHLLGGQLEIHSSPGHGTEVRVEVPLGDEGASPQPWPP